VDEVTRLDPSAIEATFRALLASDRRAALTAIDAHGLFVPLPPTLSVAGHPTLDARSALDLVDASDRTTVIDAWHRVREIGATHTRVLLRAGADATLYFFDLRERHGFLVGALVGESELGLPGPAEQVSIAPRVSMQRKQERHRSVHRCRRRNHADARMGAKRDDRARVARLRAPRRS
jgi:hypothetical protein